MADVALLIAARLQLQARPSGSLGNNDGEFSRIIFFYLGCGKKQTIAIGAAECEKCGILIQILMKSKTIDHTA